MSGSLRRYAVIALPYAWLVLFFLVPAIIVLKISVAEQVMGIPPYSPLVATGDGGWHLQPTLESYAYLWSDDLYALAYLHSLGFAALCTVLCLLLGYPMAYGIVRAPGAWRGRLLLLVILPFWTSFLIRVYAWIGLLKGNGLINNFLLSTGIIHQPLQLLDNAFAIDVGLVYSYLPFMILPLYSTLEKLDPTLLEAAADLGCKPWQAFLRVTLPLSFAGILAGSLLVFIPMVGEFVIPELLGGQKVSMIGVVLWDEFFNNREWPTAAAVAVAMLVLLALPMTVMRRFFAQDAA
jgi:putrescine transport system permease protein